MSKILQQEHGRLKAYSSVEHRGPWIFSAEAARREALARKRNQGGLNYDETMEFGYSPSTYAVGCRHDPDQQFRVFNIYYPMYGRNDDVTDWVSVGVARSKKR